MFSKDWILGAKKFDFVQNKKRMSSEEEFSTLIPQLLLEQISEGIIRTTSTLEMKDRVENELLVERQSLFLQLSKEWKVRDSLVLTYTSEKKLRKAISEQQKKIKEIEDKIDENLKKTVQLREEYVKKTEEQAGKKKTDFNLFFSPLTNLFVRKTEKLLPDNNDEIIKLYKNSPTELYSLSEESKKNGPESRIYENEMINAKINGFIDGSITIYGSYFSVSCTLYIYPGKKLACQVTEVGSLRNCSEVVNNIAAKFGPCITNNSPVELFFEITPEEIRADADLTIDGVFFDKIPEKLTIDAGTHSVKVSYNGYYSRSINYDFEKSSQFIIQADMVEIKESNFLLTMSNPVPGTVYADGKYITALTIDNAGGEIQTDRHTIIGQFKSTEKGKKTVVETITTDKGKEKEVEKVKEGDPLTFFYIVPEKLQNDGASLAVRGKPIDHAAYIDKRRIWTYRAYTLLVLSMPFTLYSMGEYNSAVRAYNARSLSTLDEVNKWNTFKNVSIGITCAAAGLFVIELVRYLVAANSVLPVNAHKATSHEIMKAQEKLKKNFPVVEIKEPEVEKSDIESTDDSAEKENGDVQETEEKLTDKKIEEK